MLQDLGLIATPDEMTYLSDAVKTNKASCTHYTEYSSSNYSPDNPLLFFGSPAAEAFGNSTGTIDEKYAKYIKFREKTDQFLQNDPVVLELLEKVKTRLSEHFKLPIEHLAGSSVPGFHMINLTGEERFCDGGGYHLDVGFAQLIPILTGQPTDLTKMYSFLIALEAPENGAGLTYAVDGKAYRTQYELGHLYMFPVLMSHNISNCVFKTKDEYRITFHGQLIVELDKIQYFW